MIALRDERRSSHLRFALAVALAAATLALLGTAPARAASASPGWAVVSVTEPTNFASSPLGGYEAYSSFHDQIEELTVDATGGTFTLTASVESRERTTAPLACDAPAAAVQEALEALSTIGAGNVSVTGGAQTCSEANGVPYVVTIDGSLSGVEAYVSANGSSLTGTVNKVTVTTVQKGGNAGRYRVLVTNVGGAASSFGAKLTDTLPPGLRALRITGRLLSEGEIAAGHLPCVLATLECNLPAVPSFETVEVTISAVPVSSAPAVVTNVATVEGGGAATVTGVGDPNFVNSPVPTPFGFGAFDFAAAGREGAASVLAGDHPNAVTATFDLSTFITNFKRVKAESGTGLYSYSAVGNPRDIIVHLPLGLVGDPLATAERCPEIDMRAGQVTCPASSQVGSTVLEGSNSSIVTSRSSLSGVSQVFNMVPEHGYPAELGVSVFGHVAFLYANVVHAKSGGYELEVTVPGLPRASFLRLASLTLFGDPAREDGVAGPGPETPFFTNPADCSAGPLQARIEADSWQEPENWASAESTAYPEVNGCDQLAFEPEIEASPTTDVADSPSGLDFDLKVPQAEGAENPATPPLRKAVITLPAGISVNPSAASGLAACKAEGPEGINIGSQEIAADGQDLGDPEATELGEGHAGGNGSPYDDGLWHTAPGHCPEASRIGTVEVTTPLLEETLPGSLYLGTPACAPCSAKDAEEGKLIHLYLEVNDPKTGVILKLAGTASTNPVTGQLTTTFAENPQLPFSDLQLHIKEGPRAPLRTPATCGPYTTTTSLTPFSAPESGPPAAPSDSYQISAGPNGGPCAGSAAQEPNAPAFTAGTVSPQAGAYSPFVLKLTREDGSQELKGLNLALPPGLTGRLAGIPYCQEADLAAAAERSGRSEQASPSCPAASEVGVVHVGAGAGPTPYYVTGHAYLAGPYKGAPLSLAIVTPAVAGPFDLGTVVVRAGLYVDPETAQITVKSDPLPTILAGVPLDIRSIGVEVDRPGFTLNPTSCEADAVTGETTSVTGQVAQLSNRFQVGGCNALAFRPKLQISLKGSTKHAGHPALKAVVTYPKQGAYANIARAQVNLPHSEFIDQGNLDKTCTKPVLLAGNCPASSIYGKARAWTPLLEKPLEGDVYLVGGYGYKLPALVAELNGQIRVVLKGKVDSGQNKGIRNTFEAVPDAPVSRFVLEMKGGPKYSLLENSENLCQKPQRAIARFTAQNGKVEQTKPLIANSCKKNKKAHHKKNKGHGNKSKSHKGSKSKNSKSSRSREVSWLHGALPW